MYVCICNAITEKEVRKAARDGARTLTDLHASGLGVATGCGQCAGHACAMLEGGQDSAGAVQSVSAQDPSHG